MKSRLTGKKEALIWEQEHVIDFEIGASQWLAQLRLGWQAVNPYSMHKGDMIMKRTTWLNTSTIFALTTMLALTAPAWADDKEDKKDKQDQGEKQAQEKNDEQPRALQSFDLKHRKPQEMQQVLALWSGQAVMPVPNTPQQRTAGFRPEINNNEERLAFAVDDENNVLFVRGPQDKVEEAGKIVEALDVAEEDLQKGAFGDTRIIPIKKDAETKVRNTFNQLQLKHQLVSMEDIAVVVVCHGDSDKEKKYADQVEEVLSKLNAEASSTKKNNDSETKTPEGKTKEKNDKSGKNKENSDDE